MRRFGPSVGAVFVLLGACSSTEERSAFVPVDAGADAARLDASHGTEPDAGSCAGADCPRLKLAFSRFYLGDTDRGGTPLSYAWEYFGEDLDGLHSNYVLNGECLPPADQPQYAYLDGINGYDNQWGARVLPLLEPWDPSPSKASDDALKAGLRRPIILLGQIGGGLTTTTLHATFTYFRDGRTEPELVRYESATFANNTFDSGPAPAPVTIELPMGKEPLRVTVQRLRVRFDLTPDGRAIGGQLSGAITVPDLEAGVLEHVTRSAPALCGGTTIEGLKKSLASAVDVLADGHVDRDATCDAVSFGVGFEAEPAEVTGTTAPAPAFTPACP